MIHEIVQVDRNADEHTKGLQLCRGSSEKSFSSFVVERGSDGKIIALRGSSEEVSLSFSLIVVERGGDVK